MTAAFSHPRAAEVVTCTPLYRPKNFIDAHRTKLMYVSELVY